MPVRLMIVIAGPLFSLALGFLLITACCFWNYNDVSARVGSVVPGGAADRSGVAADDRIVSINNKTIFSFLDVKEAAQASHGQPLHVIIIRGATHMEVELAPDAHISEESGCSYKQWLMGITAASDRYSPSLFDAMRISADQIAKTIVALVGAVARPEFLFPCQRDNRVQTRSNGGIVETLSAISIDYAFINFFPLPLMDGLEIAFCLAALARGRPIGHRSRDRLNLVAITASWTIGIVIEILSLLH